MNIETARLRVRDLRSSDAPARIAEKCGFTFAGSADGLLEFRKILTEGSDNGYPAL